MNRIPMIPFKEETQVDNSKETTESEQTVDTEALAKTVKRREKGVKQYQSFVLRALILLVILWLLFFVFIGVTHMPNGDMYPRIDSGDFLLYYRLDRSPKFRDVVVFEKTDSDGNTVMLVSRVIAVPGDTVEITEEGAVLVNGNTLAETNIYYGTLPYVGDDAPTYPLTLGENEYFVLGDRRDEAADSRSFGTVKQEELLGTLIMILRRINL